MKRIDKRTLLGQVLAGDTSELRRLRAQRGKRWRTDQRAAQRTYLTGLLNRQPADQELLTFFGPYDRSEVPGIVGIELADGLHTYLL